MHRVCVLIVSLLLAVAASAAGPITLSGGLGQVLVAEQGDLLASTVDLEANLWAGLDIDLAPHFAAAVTYTRDTAKIERWLVRHQFTERTVDKVEYNRLDLDARYLVNPGERAVIYLSAGPSLVWYGDASATGLHLSAGLRARLGDHLFTVTEVGFVHVQDFAPLPRVANAGEIRLGLAWRF